MSKSIGVAGFGVAVALVAFGLLAAGASRDLPAPAGEPAFVTVRGTHFERNGAPYSYLGANFWYGMNLGSPGPGGDRPRLLRELDRMKALGLRNLRILAASEGPDTEPWRVVPSLQPSPGVYNPAVFAGLDFLLDEMRKRDLTAVVMLGNFWEWSGGFAQYRRWAGAAPIPYPPDTGFSEYSAGFYSDPRATDLYLKLVINVITRVNTISGIRYADDPTIMAWELGNEPRGVGNLDAFNLWLARASRFIKSLDAHHLVTTGCEGDYRDAGLDLLRNHASADIDYATLHIWAQNAGIYDPKDPLRTYPKAVQWMHDLVARHLLLGATLGKPIALEEFGLARDDNSYSPQDPVTYRDRYYSDLFTQVEQAVLSGAGDSSAGDSSAGDSSAGDSSAGDLSAGDSRGVISGVNFWAWGGEASPVLPLGTWWKPGDPLMGDPAHEHQGWYSVFAGDASTLAVISDFAARLAHPRNAGSAD